MSQPTELVGPVDAVLLAGDWHGDAKWAWQVIAQIPELLPEESFRLILHTGDFGIWSGDTGRGYLTVLENSLRRVKAQLWFVDGNHEDHDLLADLSSFRIRDHGRVEITNSIHYLPRGYRFTLLSTIGTKDVLALGGAVSVDRAHRRAGYDWWPAEELTFTQCLEAALAGPADIMLTHDCPNFVPLGLPPVPPSWGWSAADLARSDAHRDRLGDVVQRVQPELLIHGHYHLRKNWTGMIPETDREIRVVSLDMNGSPGNYVVLELQDLRIC